MVSKKRELGVLYIDDLMDEEALTPERRAAALAWYRKLPKPGGMVMTSKPDGYENDDGDGFVLEGVYVIKHRTQKSILVQRMGYEPIWIPESQIHDDSEVHSGDLESHGKLIVKMWLAQEREWHD